MNETIRIMDQTTFANMYKREADKKTLIKDMMQQVIKHEEIPKIVIESKNEEVCELKMKRGAEIMSSATLAKLIEIYNEAVVHAPPNSNLLARAYANRSAVLTNGALYEDSLKDIERAMKIGYPDNLKAKLYARKAKNLLALNNKICPEVEKAVAQANIWIEKMDESNKEKVLGALNQLKSNKSLKKPFEKWDSSVFIPEIPKGNPKLLGAGSLGLVMSEEFGRHIVATKDIKAGEALIVNKLYAFILKPEYRFRFCWSCSKYVYSAVPCNHCINVIYCNETCRDKAWHEHHDVECPTISTILRQFKNSERVLFNVRILVKALKEFGSIDRLYDKIQEINWINDPILKCFTGDVFDDTKYAAVYSLFRVKDSSIIPVTASIRIAEALLILSKTTEIFGEKIENPEELMKNKWTFFIGDLMYRHFEILDTNVFELVSEDCHREPLTCGSFLAPLMDFCSHSCDRNTFHIAAGDASALVAIQPIKKNEQISVSYGPYYIEFPTAERRRLLQNEFKFFCKCSACMNNWGPTTHSSLTRQMPVEKKPEILKNFEKLKPYFLMQELIKSRTRGLSAKKIIETISIFAEILNKYEYPCVEAISLKYDLLHVYMYI